MIQESSFSELPLRPNHEGNINDGSKISIVGSSAEEWFLHDLNGSSVGQILDDDQASEYKIIFREELNERQQQASESYQHMQFRTAELARDRYLESLELRFDPEKRLRRADEIFQVIKQLRLILNEIDTALPTISPKRPIELQYSSNYLEQEILREYFRIKLANWVQGYLDKRDYIAKRTSQDFDARCEEIAIGVRAATMLSNSISDLSVEERCKRAAFILREIQMRRSSLLSSVYSAPFQVCKKSAVVIPTIVAATDHFLPMGLGFVATASTQCAYEGVKNWWQSLDYNAPERTCIALLSDRLKDNRPEVVTSFNLAGFEEYPEDVLNVEY